MSAARNLLAAVMVIAAVGCNRTPARPAREEIPAIPGGFTVNGGSSAHAELFDRAKSRLQDSDFAGAEDIYKSILRLEPANAHACLGIGTSRLLRNDLPGAALHYRQALDLNPRLTPALVGLGSVAFRQGDYQEARAQYERALSLEPNNADAHWGLGLTFEALGRITDAKSHFATFLELAPDSERAGAVRAKLEATR